MFITKDFLLKWAKKLKKERKKAKKTIKEYVDTFLFLVEKLDEASPSFSLIVYFWGDLLSHYFDPEADGILKYAQDYMDESTILNKLKTLYEVSVKDRYPVGLTKRDFPSSRKEEEEEEEKRPTIKFEIKDEEVKKEPKEIPELSPETKEEVATPFTYAIKSEIGKSLPDVISKNLSRIQEIQSYLEQILPFCNKKEYQILVSLKSQLDKTFEYLNDLNKKFLETNFQDISVYNELINLSKDLKALVKLFR